MVKALASQELKQATQLAEQARQSIFLSISIMPTFERILVVISLISPKIKYQVCVCNAKTTEDFVCIHKIHGLDKNTQF